MPEEGSDDQELIAVRRNDGSWLVDGQTAFADLEATLDVAVVERERPGYQTVGGFVMSRLGHLPASAEHFACAGQRFELVDMDGRRIDNVLVARDPLGGDGCGEDAAACRE